MVMCYHLTDELLALVWYIMLYLIDHYLMWFDRKVARVLIHYALSCRSLLFAA